MDASAPKVIVLGGGVAGMSAAHELAERGFAVEVYEGRAIPGGKARSLPAADPTRDRPGRPSPPGEHGFRFFPGFYKHVVDTMARIPYRDRTVADNLVDTTKVHIARFGRPPVFYPARFPQSPAEAALAIRFVLGLLGAEIGVPPLEVALFIERIFKIASSCGERRLADYERISWWEFVDAGQRSPAYQSFFANAFTRTLVAAKAERASARTIGDTFLSLLLSAATPLETADRLLNGPTNDVWIDPWLAHLRRMGVAYHFGAEVTGLTCEGGAIRSARVAREGRVTEVKGDHFIAALPVERMVELVTPAVVAADPALENLRALRHYVEWMNGIQFFLREDRPLVHGHSIYMDSPWALTSISQRQFWPDFDLSQYGSGRVRGIVSVCISDWDKKGLHGKEARACTREEIKEEVWEQLKRSLNVEGKEVLRDDLLEGWFLDPSIEHGPDGRPTSAEPLLVNYVDTWRLRPEAVTGIRNLFLASDYVRTYTDLATMEAANEAARRAVNGVVAASGRAVAPCPLWNLHEPEVFAPLRAYDRERFRRGQPWDGTLAALCREPLEVAAAAAPRVMTAAHAAEGARADIAQQLAAYRALVEPQLARALAGREPRRHLYALIEEHLSRSGKGMRPALCLATTRALGGDASRAIPSAAALEMLHNAFLVHDDIEDESERRRDQPSMYVEHGLPLAVNAGDAMQALSLRMLRDNVPLLGPELAWRIVEEFDHLLIESLEGQATELGWIRENNCTLTEDDYLLLVLKKTCWYSFIQPCRIGALIARGPSLDVSRFDRFGFLLGAAFQIQDDVLNLVGEGKKVGKVIGDDLWEGKRTLILSHLFRRVSGAEADRLREVLGKPRGQRLPREIDWMYELLAREGSIDFATRAARELAVAAERELERAYADAAEGPDKQFIRRLVCYTVEREL